MTAIMTVEHTRNICGYSEMVSQNIVWGYNIIYDRNYLSPFPWSPLSTRLHATPFLLSWSRPIPAAVAVWQISFATHACHIALFHTLATGDWALKYINAFIVNECLVPKLNLLHMTSLFYMVYAHNTQRWVSSNYHWACMHLWICGYPPQLERTNTT